MCVAEEAGGSQDESTPEVRDLGNGGRETQTLLIRVP